MFFERLLKTWELTSLDATVAARELRFFVVLIGLTYDLIALYRFAYKHVRVINRFMWSGKWNVLKSINRLGVRLLCGTAKT